MATRPLEARSLMDEFLPNHDFSAAYDISINAPSSVVCECLLRSDLNELWLVRLLMSIRSGKWLPRNRMPGDLRQRLQGTGFVILGEVPNEEIVIGVAGRFWRPDGGRCLDLTADDFAGSPRLCEGSVEFQAAGRVVASEHSSFDGDKNQVLWFGGVHEVSPLLDVGCPVLWTHAKGDP
jgi:hypothetical protein